MARQNIILTTLSLALIGVTPGCMHTGLAPVGSGYVPTGKIIGVRSVCDINGFNYADELRRDLLATRLFQDVIVTHDLADKRCDYVIRGEFDYSRVKVRTGLFYTSIYFFMLPTLTGLPTAYLDGQIEAAMEVYRDGRLLHLYEYRDVFREVRSVVTLYPSGTGFAQELDRVAKLFAEELTRDITGQERRTSVFALGK